MKNTKIILFFFGVLVLSSCSVKGRRIEIPVKSVAILPFANETTNLDGPVMLRKKIYDRISKIIGYKPVPLNEVDTKLLDLGITDGGQLKAVTATEVGKMLGADILVYGNLLVFNPSRISLGDVVRLNLKMVDPGTEKPIWEQTKGIPSLAKVKTDKSVQDNITDRIKLAFVEKIFRAPLGEETDKLVFRMIYDMPRY